MELGLLSHAYSLCLQLRYCPDSSFMMSTCTKKNKKNVAASIKDDAAQAAKAVSKRTASLVQRKPSRSQKTSGDAATVEGEVLRDIEKCGVCEQRIIDGKEQALFCEGVCKHGGCIAFVQVFQQRCFNT